MRLKSSLLTVFACLIACAPAFSQTGISAGPGASISMSGGGTGCGVGSPCSISSGGTGQTSAAAALQALGGFVYPGTPGIPYGISLTSTRAATALDLTTLLGFTPLNPANNLSDVSTPATALKNIGGAGWLTGTGAPTATCSSTVNTGYSYTNQLNAAYQCSNIVGAVYQWNLLNPAQVYPASGIPTSTGSAWGASYTAQGTDTKLLTVGTISGTGAAICTDAQAGATTSSCNVVPTITGPSSTVTGAVTINGSGVSQTGNTLTITAGAGSNTALDCSTFSGSTVDVKVNACITAAIANGNGVADARLLGGSQTIAAQINLGDHARDSIVLLLPKQGNWKSTINDGSSCAIKQFTNSALFGYNTGNPNGSGGSNQFSITTASGLSTGPGALWCNEPASVATGGGSYVRVSGVGFTNTGLATMGLGASVVSDGWFDNSDMDHTLIFDGKGTSLIIRGACCSAGFHDVTADGLHTATAPTLVFQNTATQYNGSVILDSISIDHPAPGYPNIKCTNTPGSFAGWDQIEIRNLYTESNSTDTTTTLFQCDSAMTLSIDHWVALRRNSSSTASAIVLTNSGAAYIKTQFRLTDFSWADSSGSSTNAVNDQINGIVMPTTNLGVGVLGGGISSYSYPETGVQPIQLTIAAFTAAANSCYTGSGTLATTALIFSSVAMPGLKNPMAPHASFMGNPIFTVGWGQTGGMSLKMWPDSGGNQLDYIVCNVTGSSIAANTTTLNVGVN